VLRIRLKCKEKRLADRNWRACEAELSGALPRRRTTNVDLKGRLQNEGTLRNWPSNDLRYRWCSYTTRAWLTPAQKPKAYSVTEIEVTNSERLKPYLDGIATTVPQAGGSPKPLIAIVEWHSIEEARTFFFSDDYANLIPSREAGSDFGVRGLLAISVAASASLTAMASPLVCRRCPLRPVRAYGGDDMT
jgi:uncharacterized protein (DUF1330 family)